MAAKMLAQYSPHIIFPYVVCYECYESPALMFLLGRCWQTACAHLRICMRTSWERWIICSVCLWYIWHISIKEPSGISTWCLFYSPPGICFTYNKSFLCVLTRGQNGGKALNTDTNDEFYFLFQNKSSGNSECLGSKIQYSVCWPKPKEIQLYKAEIRK